MKGLKKMRKVELTLSNYLKEKREAMIEKEVAEINVKLRQMMLNRISKGEKGFRISLKMTPAAYQQVADSKLDFMDFELLNAERINFKNQIPQTFELRHVYRLF